MGPSGLGELEGDDGSAWAWVRRALKIRLDSSRGLLVWAEDTGAEVSAGSSLAIQKQEDHQLDCSKPQREVALGDDRMCPSFGSINGQCHLAWRAKQG